MKTKSRLRLRSKHKVAKSAELTDYRRGENVSHASIDAVLYEAFSHFINFYRKT